jgi:hypothetical protein
MPWRWRALRSTSTFATALFVFLTLPHYGMVPAAADDWIDKVDAVTKLWNARQRPVGNDTWPITKCDKWDGENGLTQDEKLVASSTVSGLVVPKVKITDSGLTDYVQSIARAFLDPNYNLDGTDNFLPKDTSRNARLTYNTDFWAENLRSTHQDTDQRLPAPALGTLDQSLNLCPAELKKAPAVLVRHKLPALRLLQSATNTDLTNKIRWHCYTNAFNTVEIHDVNSKQPTYKTYGTPGFVELKYWERQTALQYKSEAGRESARYVFDYTQKRLYFTATHYEPWYKENMTQVPENTDLATYATKVCNPFFELVP